MLWPETCKAYFFFLNPLYFSLLLLQTFHFWIISVMKHYQNSPKLGHHIKKAFFFSHCQHKLSKNAAKLSQKKKTPHKTGTNLFWECDIKIVFFFSGAWKRCKHRHARDIISLSWYSKRDEDEESQIIQHWPVFYFSFFFFVVVFFSFLFFFAVFSTRPFTVIYKKSAWGFLCAAE